MKETRVALRYAKSLFSLAKERQSLLAVKEDMQTIFTVCNECSDFNNMLKSPIVKKDKKLIIINKVFTNNLSMLSMDFLKIITEKKREAILKSIAENFILLYNNSKNIVLATVTTPTLMSDDLRSLVYSKIKTIVGDAEIQVEEHIDEALIGGFILRIGDKEFDSSVANKLQKLKREFVSNPYIKEY